LNDSFYINFLKFYVRKAGEEFPDLILIDKNNRFLMNRLLDERILKEKIKYLVKWIRYSDYNNIWKPLQNLDNCEIAIYDFRIRRVSERSAKRVKKIRKRRKKRSWKRNLSSKYKGYQIYMEIRGLKIMNEFEDSQIRLN
jgi:hypothetical protein